MRHPSNDTQRPFSNTPLIRMKSENQCRTALAERLIAPKSELLYRSLTPYLYKLSAIFVGRLTV